MIMDIENEKLNKLTLTNDTIQIASHVISRILHLEKDEYLYSGTISKCNHILE